jgi:hypothetical protein
VKEDEGKGETDTGNNVDPAIIGGGVTGGVVVLVAIVVTIGLVICCVVR